MLPKNLRIVNMKIRLGDELVRSFKVVKVFREGEDKITSIDFSPNGEHLISCSEDDTVGIFDCENGIQTAIINSKNSTKVDDKIRYLNLNDNKYLHYFAGHVKKVISLCISPTDYTFLSGSMDKTVRIWDLRLPECQGNLHLSGRPMIAYDPDGLIFAVGVNSEVIKLYDLRVYGRGPFDAFKLNREKELEWTKLKFSKDGKTILICTNGSIIRLIDAFHGTPLQTLTGHLNNEGVPIESSFTPDSRFVFSGSGDGRIHVWNAETGYKICVLNGGHPSSVQCVQFNPKYAMLASACTDMAFWLPVMNDFEELPFISGK